jgi:predicted DCC family thiol-disulfide oxidoreductase YuxK
VRSALKRVLRRARALADPITRPALLFDGDCGFCRNWVGYWRGVTGESVEYLPYQEAAERFPEVPVEDCKQAVQLVTADGRFSGAEAVARLLGDVPGCGCFLWCYRFVPGFAALASFAYRLVADHRNAAGRITHFLWGDRVERSEYHTASELFSRALAIIYAVAFLSFGLQLRGLIGSDGILPAHDFLNAVHKQLGGIALWRLPTLFWWGSSDLTLLSIAWGGVALSLISLITKPHSGKQRLIFIVLWAYYLSIVNAGQLFMSYQWDWLLVEAGFLGIFLQPFRSRLWLYRWLIFRLMLESGLVKIMSGDPNWRHFTALKFHYETQPLPTPIAWYMHLLPEWFQMISVGFVFAIELVVPFLMLFPRRLRHFAGMATIVLQCLILLTGNYTFFNLLTMALCLFLFDDSFFARWKLHPRPSVTVPPNRWVGRVVWAVVVFLSCVEIGATVNKLPTPIGQAARQISQFGIVNHYGLFAVMTTERMEIQIEGSQDGKTWEPYLFRYKPGPLNRSLPWVQPYQPRLDWQMWFAALSPARSNPWFIRMMVGLLRGSKEINALFAQAPFSGLPPKFVRATIYQYHFTSWDERQRTGNYWTREIKGLYFPVVGLRSAGQ